MKLGVVILDADDRIVEGGPAGIPFLELLAPWSRAKGRLLCDVIRNEGGAYDWELEFGAGGRTRIRRVVGGRSGSAITIAVAETAADALAVLEEGTRAATGGDAALRGAAGALGRKHRRRPAESDDVFRDLWRVTGELAAAHRELVRKNNQLELLRADRDRMLGMVVHDLRTPLQAVRMAATILERASSAPAEALVLGERIERASTMMLRLIDDLIDLSAIQSGELKLEISDCDLRATIEAAVGVVALVAHERGVAVRPHVDPNLAIRADCARLEQVLMNLVENAVRHTKPGSEVVVDAMMEASSVHVRIADRGPGVPPDLRERIFQPWTQGAARGRAGLGLAISRRIVEAHGGQIWCEDRPGGGAVFAFSLPAGAESPQAAVVRGA